MTRRLGQRLLRPLAALLTLAWVLVLVQEVTGVGRMRALPMGGEKEFQERENRWVWHLPRRYATHVTELTAQLTEDDRPLFRVTSHREVRQHGSGRFRLHGRLVSFAPWDNSDPNTNGRRYVFYAPRPFKPALVWGGLALVAGAHWLARRGIGSAAFPNREKPPDPKWWASSTVLFFSMLGVSLAVRAALVIANPEPNDGFMMARGMPYSDAQWWLDMTRSMADGHGLSGASNGQRPVYPLMLSPWLAMGVSGVAAAQWFNVVLGAAAAAVAGMLVTRLAGPLAGAALAVFMSAGGMQLRMLPLPMSETTGLALLVTSLALLWRGAELRKSRDLFLGGVFFGLSNLACPFTLLGLPLAGVVAAARRGRWTGFIRRGAWVAAGASLIVIPWLVRQKMTHGIATISLNGPQMLYATASPSGRYDTSVAIPILEAGVAGDPAREAQEYARLFRETVRRDPGVYFARLRDGFTAWWLKFDPQHPAFVLSLILFGFVCGLHRWWKGGGPGALAAAALVPPSIMALSRLDGGWWMALAAAGALLTTDRRCWRLAGLALSVVPGCAAMNALTSGALANRLWVMADWLILALALITLRHGIATVSAWRGFDGVSAASGTRDPAAGGEVRGLDGVAWVQGAWIACAALVVTALAMRGPAPVMALPAPAAEAALAARIESLAVTGLAGRVPADSPLLWSGPVRLGPHRACLPGRQAVGHWSRAFAPRNETRTVIAAAAATRRPATLQIPGDVRSLPPGPWFAVGILNHDPDAFFGAEIDMIEVVALWPLDPGGEFGPRDQALFFPPRSTARRVLQEGLEDAFPDSP